MIEVIFGLAVIVLSIATIVMPWIHRSQIKDLKAELRLLKAELYRITRYIEGEVRRQQQSESSVPEVKREVGASETPQPAKLNLEEVLYEQDVFEDIADTPAAMPAKSVESEVFEDFSNDDTSIADDTQKPKLSFEQQFGARLPVWIGGIALALAGFYLVKYTIETGLLTPAFRTVLGLLFGGVLLAAAKWIRSKPNFANGTRIAQALSGAGIADLYVCIFAATSLYHLVPPFIGFAGMAATTAGAVVLSLRHGMPIALLGLIGGFLTPAMIDSDNPNAPVLFIYLYFVIAGLMYIIRMQKWWGLALPTVLGAFAWVGLWVAGNTLSSGDAMVLTLFLLAVSATVVKVSREVYAQESEAKQAQPSLPKLLNYVTLIGALTLTAVVASKADYGLMEWGLYGLLSLGGIVLAYFNQKLYGFVPWCAMAVNLVMLAAWDTADHATHALVLWVFAVMFIISSYILQSRSQRPLWWAGLGAAACLFYYFLGYYQFHDSGLDVGIPRFWGVLALALAAFNIMNLKDALTNISDRDAEKQQVLAVQAATVTAFLSTALTIEIPREFLSVAFALEMAAVAWISTRIDVKALRMISGVLGGVFAFLLLPQIVLLLQLTAFSLFEARLNVQDAVPIVDWPTFQLGIPALCFFAAAYCLRQIRDSRLVNAFEVSGIALIGVMGYYLIRHAFNMDANILFVKAGFMERGVITNVLFIYGLCCLAAGREFARLAVSWSGMWLCGVAVFRVVYFDLLVYNPLWAHQAVGEYPLLNYLLLTYALPLVWLWRMNSALPQLGKVEWAKFGYGLMLVLAFTFITLNIRQMFHGTYLDEGITSNSEIYTYSAAWLLFGIGLLFLGTLRRDKMIRIASLVIMIVTVAKVFLYDASELEGLFRVFSFLGLGLSLMGLSWFYTRFVFNREREGSRL